MARTTTNSFDTPARLPVRLHDVTLRAAFRLESTRTILSGLLFQTTGVSGGQTSKWPDSQGLRESGMAFLLLISSLMTLDLFTDGTTVIGAGILLGFVFVLSFTINLAFDRLVDQGLPSHKASGSILQMDAVVTMPTLLLSAVVLFASVVWLWR